MADISIKKLNESFIEISAPEDISYNIYSRYSEYVAGYQFSPRYKTLRTWDGKHHSFNMRSRRESIFRMGSINWYLVGAMALSLVLSTAVIYIPFLKKAFDFAAISAAEYFTALVIAIMVIPIVELVKLIQRKLNR